jgi:prepilin-type N-terminal cleavage/methylation domain-containing protein
MTMQAQIIASDSKSSPRRGFTIFEVLIAVALLSIGLMALAAMQVLGVRGNVDGEDRSVATALASAKLNEFMAMNYSQNSETGETTWDPALNSTGGWIDARLVNNLGFTAEEMLTEYPTGDFSKEQFRYTMSWIIEDVGDQTKPGAWKRVSLRVTWKDRSVAVEGELGQIELDSVPLAPQYL